MALANALENTQKMTHMPATQAILGDYPTCDGLCGQLRQTAWIIGSRTARMSERDVFFVEFGGFDMHINMKLALASRFWSTNNGMKK